MPVVAAPRVAAKWPPDVLVAGFRHRDHPRTMETNMKAITPLAALAVLAATSVLAQQPQMSMGAQTAVNLPEACRTAGQAGGHADMMQKMHSSMSQSMQSMQGMMNSDDGDAKGPAPGDDEHEWPDDDGYDGKGRRRRLDLRDDPAPPGSYRHGPSRPQGRR